MKFFLVLAFLFLAAFCNAQNCTGSVGDPIVNVTFGSGSSFGPPLASNTISSLNYVASTCPPDGNYSILNYTSGCFSNDVVWHTAKDHTGNSNGYFMLINASYIPSDFYIQTIDGLCSGTTYQFAAWIINMCSFTGTLPNITLTIEKTDGSVLATYKTGDIPIVNPVTWKQYGFNFTMPANVSTVVLRMRNNAPGGIGNDIGLDDITFRPIGPAVKVAASAFSGDTIDLCLNDTQNILLTSDVESCYFSTGYQWQLSTDKGAKWTDIPGANSTMYLRNATQAGTYLYRLAVAEQSNLGSLTCRVTSKPVTINVYSNDSRTIKITTPSSSVCEDNPVSFIATTSYGGSSPDYQWFLNSAPVGTNSNAYTLNDPDSGDVVNCLFTSSIPCNTPVLSNSITVMVNSKKNIIVNESICEGENYAGYTTSGTYVNTFTGINGCDSTRTLNLMFYPKGTSETDTSICYGTSYQGFDQTGIYTQQFTTTHSCDSLHTIHLTVLPDINENLYTDTILCTGDSIILYPGLFDSYLWQDGSVNSTFIVSKGGIYSVKVANKCGTGVKQMTVTEQSCDILFPNAFTPNNDGLNDIFKVLNGYHLTYFHFVVYNRWGQKIFESDDPKKGWNGKIEEREGGTGTYEWTCDYVRVRQKLVHLKGTVTLIK
ncbi:MAG: gliding motility-associated C-terminal domain-containing protein [Bacteroidota bacterium]|nr:gliding motility-associated C-terminal domain-containing protein [Bacteroidota bacterium]